MTRRVIRFQCDKPPSVNAAYATDWKSKRRFKSHEYERWLSSAEASLWMTKFHPIAGPVHITITIADEGRVDLGNHEKILIDFCVKHKMIADDKRSIVRKIVLQWGQPGTGALVEIEEAPNATVNHTIQSKLDRSSHTGGFRSGPAG
jgi:Holliday junction resolvase RusA-like endonuclease